MAMAHKSFNKFAFFLDLRYFGGSIMLLGDWLIRQLLLKREF